MIGSSDEAWGLPLRPKEFDFYDAFVAKLDANGNLQWNTFLGGPLNDSGHSIAVDVSGNIYVTGLSNVTWGSPLRPFAGGASDAFVAKLDTNGNLQWNTFLGGLDHDAGYGIAVDTSENIYVIGSSDAAWGSPLRPFAGGASDAFVAKLDTNGNLQWNTFLGGSGEDCTISSGIAVDTSGNIYVTGMSYFESWGLPLRPFDGILDAFVAKLDTNGNLQWNTFLGKSGSDFTMGWGIALDTSGNSYVIGTTNNEGWGSPLRPFAGIVDAFVAKLDTNGALQWNTFLGGTDTDYGSGISVDTSGNSYLSGTSYAAWGSPLWPFTGIQAAFVAKLDANGNLQWNTFLGGLGNNSGSGIAVDTYGDFYITGSSDAAWGSPLLPFAGNGDVFVAKISAPPTITSLSPSSAIMGDAGFILSVLGSGFANGAVVKWDGNDRPTTVVDSSELEATIRSSDLAIGRIVPVAIQNPDGGVSSAMDFVINNPVSSLTSLSPARTTGGGAGFDLTVLGSKFVSNAVILWNGNSRSTTYISSTELRGEILAADIATGGEAQVTVSNPNPTLGVSNSLIFPVSSFTMTSSPASAIVNGGQSATFTIQLTPQYGTFDSSVSFECTGLPSKCTASFSPTSATPGSNVVTTTLTLSTKANSSSSAGTILSSADLIPPTMGLILAILALARCLIIRKPASRKFSCSWLTASALTCLIVLLASCSVGGDGNPLSNGTPPGTYQVSVIGLSGSLTIRTNVFLTVR